MHPSSGSTMKPTVVRNPLDPDTGYDTPLRAFCRKSQLIYQGFWMLTANRTSLQSRPV